MRFNFLTFIHWETLPYVYIYTCIPVKLLHVVGSWVLCLNRKKGKCGVVCGIKGLCKLILLSSTPVPVSSYLQKGLCLGSFLYL